MVRYACHFYEFWKAYHLIRRLWTTVHLVVMPQEAWQYHMQCPIISEPSSRSHTLT